MINSNEFCDQFEDPDHKDFSYAAKMLMYRYFCDNNLDLEVDAISLSTDYNENTWEQCLKEFDLFLGDIDNDDDDAIQQMIKAYLDEETIVIGTTADSIVYASF